MKRHDGKFKCGFCNSEFEKIKELHYKDTFSRKFMVICPTCNAILGFQKN